MEYSLNFRLLQTNEPIYMKAYFRWTKMIQFCKKCKSNNKMFLGCFPTAFIDDPSLKKLNASRKGLRAHVVMIHRRSVQRSLHLQRNKYNHTNIQTYKLKNTIDQNPLLSDDPSLVYMNQFTSQRNTHKHTNIHNKKHHS